VALSADGRGALIWRPAKSVVFAGVHWYSAPKESPAALSADRRGTLIWRPAKSLVFARGA
jgi:hypothetical protein